MMKNILMYQVLPEVEIIGPKFAKSSAARNTVCFIFSLRV